MKEIEEWMDCLGLELNQKTGIFPLRNGIDFLGFHSYLTETGACVQKLRQSNIDRMSSRVKFWRKACAEGTITKEKILGKFQAWDAYAAHGDTYALRQKFAGQVKEIIGVMPEVHRKINSTLESRNKRRARQYRNIQKKRGEPVSPAPIFRSEPSDDDLPPWM